MSHVGDLARGAYDQLITDELASRLAEIDRELISRASLDPADAHEALSRHIASLADRALSTLATEGTGALEHQIAFANELIAALAERSPLTVSAADLVSEAHELLLAVVDRLALPGPAPFPDRPQTPLSSSALLVNGRDQPRIGTEVQRELASADRVDLLCAFVKWHGLRVLDEQIAALTRRGGGLRLITTTYMGASERRAIDRFVELGAQVRISYETRMTRLHAKAWLFHRATGFSTAYVGSSNLSRAALLDGLEWNVRLSAVEQGHLLDTFRATFDEYWEDSAFEPYDSKNPVDVARLDEALAAARGGLVEMPLQISTLEVRPWGYQQEVLDDLQAEREVHDRWRNLVVMATGTGKTIVAGLDYRRLQEAGTVDSVLFVAHREEILDQSLATFRQIMRDGSFGERFVAGDRPKAWRHVFASVQSLAQLDLERDLAPNQFDMVIIDEFHHAAETTPTYARLLRHVQPRVLLGLTATPERADGVDVKTWFGGRIASELRLWEALERGLLVPFQYFAIHDTTDLRAIRWKRGLGYATVELTNLYTGHDARVRIVLQSLRDKVSDVGRMRALGFCVSIDHAEYMARKFNEAGLPSLALTSRSSSGERAAGLRALRAREVNAVFTVDLFNEGVDIPEIDTVLFLRPTESSTVFLQQLGRGLRLADEKPCLTVLDFIGNQNADFRFDLRYRAITGVSRKDLTRAIEHGFPNLPAGCHIALDRVATQIVLDNVKSALRINWRALADELRRLGDVGLSAFLDAAGLTLEDVYRGRRGGWTQLRRTAGFEDRPTTEDDDRLGAAFGRMLHIDDLERIGFLSQLLEREQPPPVSQEDSRNRRLMAMLHFGLWGANEPPTDLSASIARFWANAARRDELAQVVLVLRARIHRVSGPLSQTGKSPLRLHATYSRDEALAAFGIDNPDAVRQGVKWVEGDNADVFFVTLRKTEQHYSPTTMYQDRAITPSLFQWESQSTTSTASPVGQRYVHHRARGSSVHLFIRESKEGEGDLGAPPYLYAGPASYASHSGDRPMRILWKLQQPLPAEVFHNARVAAG